jgi:uncharacterized damage-inducible protein DinB
MSASTNENVLSSKALLDHWQGHRRLTRRVIEAFPEDKLFTFTIGSMRSFGDMVKEFLRMTVPIAHGVATGEWQSPSQAADASGLSTKQDLLRRWDADTEQLNSIWPTISGERFAAVEKVFGQWENSGINTILYGIDNEIHHRGQGFVYLRALGIDPPAFWDR